MLFSRLARRVKARGPDPFLQTRPILADMYDIAPARAQFINPTIGFALKASRISARTKAVLVAAKARGVTVPIPVSPSSGAQRTSPASSPPLGGGDLFDLLGRVGAGIVRVRHKVGRAAEHDARRH